MPCDWLKSPDGTVIHINRGRSGGKKKRCPFCRSGSVSKLCDFPIGDGKTCDAEMCDRCATTKGAQHTAIGGGFTKLNDTLDYCPNHKNGTPTAPAPARSYIEPTLLRQAKAAIPRKDVPDVRQPHVTKLMDISLTSATGCKYNEGTAEKPAICKRACDDGQDLCPRHILIAAHEEELRKAEATRQAQIERTKNVSPMERQKQHG